MSKEEKTRKFEAGKRYESGAVKFEIVSRTAKTVTYKLIQHAGRTNERAGEAKKAKVKDWGDTEYFFTGIYEVMA